MKLIARFSLILLFFFSFTVRAEIPDQLKNDFSPLSGSIVMPIGDEYLVNLDASMGLHEGDILTIIMLGEKIIDPNTKKVLGTLELPKGFLQVTRIKSGYSYTKLLTTNVIPAKGDKVKRFEQTPCRFTNKESAIALANDLEYALPHLHWLKSTDETKPLLFFSVNEQGLEISDATGTKLKNYPYNNGQLTVPVAGINHSDSFQLGDDHNKKTLLNQAVNNVTGIIGWGGKDKRLENPGITQALQLNNGIWISTNLKGNPVGLAVADFDGDGHLETAIAMQNSLKIYRIVGKKLTLVSIVNFAAGVNLLALDQADIDKNGISELYITANNKTKISSQVVEFTQGRYKKTQSQLPWFFRAIDIPNEGHILLAQTLGRKKDHPFSTPLFRVSRSGDHLIKGEDFPLPTKINIMGFTPFIGEKHEPLYAFISDRDHLGVKTPSGNTIWESNEQYNGSDVPFDNVKDSEKELSHPVYIQQRVLNLPSGEILVAKNEGSRLFVRYRIFDKSQLIAFKWYGGTLQQTWSTSEQGGYLADFSWADADNDGQDELIMVIKYKQKNLLQEGHSAIVIYENTAHQNSR